MLQQGDTNAAINMLMVCHEMSIQQNANGFNTLLNTLLTIGKLPEAEYVYRNTIAQHDRLLQDYFNRPGELRFAARIYQNCRVLGNFSH